MGHECSRRKDCLRKKFALLFFPVKVAFGVEVQSCVKQLA